MSRGRGIQRRVSIGICPALEMALASLPKDGPQNESWWLRMALSEAIYAYASCFENGPEMGWKTFGFRLEVIAGGERRGLVLEREEKELQAFLDGIADDQACL